MFLLFRLLLSPVRNRPGVDIVRGICGEKQRVPIGGHPTLIRGSEIFASGNNRTDDGGRTDEASTAAWRPIADQSHQIECAISQDFNRRRLSVRLIPYVLVLFSNQTILGKYFDNRRTLT